MAHGPASSKQSSVDTSIDSFVQSAVQQYRAKLLDLSSRNPLVNFRHSEKSRTHIRIVDEIPETLFGKLEASRQMWFEPVEDPVLTPPDEDTPRFREALRRAKQTDDVYKKSIQALGPMPSERKRQKVERELRNKIRATFGWPEYAAATDVKKRAVELGINTDYDLPKGNGQNRRRYLDQKLQTLYFREDLDRKLGHLREAARSLLQDAGLSALYCAFAFLEYYESNASDEKRVAPLLFYPIEIDRELQNGEYRYFIVPRNDDAEVNVALRELLKRDFSIELPAWAPAEGEADPLGNYLTIVETLIRSRPDWKVRRYITVGLFTFSTLVMYNDLDPEKWKQHKPLHQRSVLRTLIAGAESHGGNVAPDYEIDKVSDPDPLLITDADSSQHSAVIDVLKGKNTVIQGPPGTGKSQTLTNIISAALNAGKTILFVAEKMAALEVVKKRLDAAGIGPFCLELHSSKTSKSAIVQSLSTRLEHVPHPPRQLTLQNNLNAIGKARQDLIHYVEKTNEPAGNTGLTVREVLLGSAMRDGERVSFPDTVANARFAEALAISPQVRQQMADSAGNLERQLSPLLESGPLREHPWRGIQNCELTELEMDELLSRFRDAESELATLGQTINSLSEMSSVCLPETPNDLDVLFSAAERLPHATGLEDAELFRRLAGGEARKIVDRVITSITTSREIYALLQQYLGEVQSATTVDRQQLASAVLSIERTMSGQLNLVQLDSHLSELRARRALLGTASAYSQHLAALFDLRPPSIQNVRASVAALDCLSMLPRDLWALRDRNTLDEDHCEVIAAGAKRLDDLRHRRQDLEKRWVPELLPTAAMLRGYVVALRTTNWFTSLFNSSCRSSRALAKAARTDSRRTYSREELAQEWSKAAQLKEDENRFDQSAELATCLGSKFHGISTDFRPIVTLSTWGKSTRTSLARFGKVGLDLCNQLFTSSKDDLLVRLSAKDASEFAKVAEVSQLHDLGATTTIEEAIKDLDEKLHIYEQVLGVAQKLHFKVDCPLSHLQTVDGKIRELDRLKSVIDRDASQLRFTRPESNLEALVATLQFAEGIAATKLNEGLRSWLLKELSNTLNLRLAFSEISAKLQRALRAVVAADEIAKFDWELWCQCEGARAADIKQLQERFRRATEHSRLLQDYLNFLLAEDRASECGIGPVLAAFTTAKQEYRQLTSAVDYVFYRSAAEQILNLDPRLRRHSGASHDQLRAQFQELDREFIDLRRRLLATRVRDREIPEGNNQGRVADLTELALVRHVAGQVRPRIAVRDLLRRAGRAMQALTPCWMMSPMSVAQFLEPGYLQFDLVLMDEASQIRPEEALGAVARAGQLVVVGDQMQLPPTSFFQSLSTDSGADDDETEDVQQESVLEAAAARFYPPRMLKWHYRSEHGSLISFSNYEFYGDELTVFPSPYHDHPEYGIKLHQVNGVYGAGTNEEEAQAVVEEAARFMAAHSDRSLGIVAVNSKQAELIRELVDQRCASDPEAEAYRSKWSLHLESFFVKNLENVQGDERDAIFVSTVYGKDKSGNFYQRFGPINSASGHRRLNVLFTRAKKRLELFTSMRSEDIQDEGKQWGVRALKGYLQFANTGSWLLPTASDSECDSEFEEWVLRNLRANGFEAVPQLGFAGYRIDIAVRHPDKPGTFICGIECDGATYHSAKSVRERDRLRQEVLERLGWNIYRIWSTDWFRNPNLQTRNLIKHLKTLQRESS